MNDDDKIDVCDACLMASCWAGVFMCDEAKYAGTTTRTVAELRALDLEHPDNWKSPSEDSGVGR